MFFQPILSDSSRATMLAALENIQTLLPLLISSAPKDRKEIFNAVQQRLRAGNPLCVHRNITPAFFRLIGAPVPCL